MVLANKKAQTAIELALFGSILIFVLGGTIKSVMGRGHQQHALLRATRMALTISHVTTESKTVSGRNMGSVLIVEDRLTAASSKYGAVDRMPFLTQGSGIHSANLFMPIDYGHAEDLPKFDMYVNGKHFAFSTSGYKYVNLAAPCQNAAPCPADCFDPNIGALDCSASSPFYFRGADIPPGPDYWEPGCLESTVTQTTITSCDVGAAPCPPGCTDCSAGSTDTYNVVTITQTTIGCAKLYTIVNNHPLIPDWCNGNTGAIPLPCDVPIQPCSVLMAPGCNLSAIERFTLDRATGLNPAGLDGVPTYGAPPLTWDIPPVPGAVQVPPAEWPGFAWQWFLVAGVQADWTRPPIVTGAGRLSQSWMPGTIITSVDAALQMGEGIILPGGETKAQNISLDVDYDLKMEKIMPNVEDGPTPNIVGNNGVIIRLGVMDSQLGDIDFSNGTSEENLGVLQFGFLKDVNLYTYVHGAGPKGGTYFQLDEGQLFQPTMGDTRQFVRTASKKDQIDLIERVFRLSHDTGEFCGTVVGGPPNATANGIPNPVEACGWGPGECFITANMNLTCMDVPNKLIFIRSRIEDLHGRMWVTDESSDPYVDFVIN